MLLVWSGGCDSTLLLHDLVKDSSERNPVRTIAIVHPQIGAMKEQRVARQKILKWMKKHGHHISHQEVEIKHINEENILCRRSNGARGGDGISQYTIWMFSAISYLDREEDLYMGYISGDDIWYYRHEVEESFRLLLYIMGKEGKIKFPLERVKKCTVISSLKEKKLYDLTWYCESPDKGKCCGRCDPCVKHDTALYEIKMTKKRSNIVQTCSKRPASLKKIKKKKKK